jgi:hypothetical protein
MIALAARVTDRVGCACPTSIGGQPAPSEPGTIFLHDEFLQAFEKYLNKPLRRFPAFDSDELVAGICGLLEATPAGTALRRIPLFPWHCFWLPAGESNCPDERRRKRVFDKLIESIQAEFAAASFDLHPDITDVRPFTWAGWKAEVRYTYQTELENWDPRSTESSVRRRTRRAAAAGVSVCDDLAVDSFVDLLSKSQHPSVSPESLRVLLKTMLDRRLCQLWGAHLPDGRLAACTCLLFDGSTAYYWLSAFDRDEPHHGASNQLLHLEMISALGSSARLLDWVGANTPSIAKYKESFSPRLVSYYRVHWKNQAIQERRDDWKSWIRSCPLFRRAQTGV